MDKHEVGFISESSFKQIMNGKDDVREADIAEMLEEYYRFVGILILVLHGGETIMPLLIN